MKLLALGTKWPSRRMTGNTDVSTGGTAPKPLDGQTSVLRTNHPERGQ